MPNGNIPNQQKNRANLSKIFVLRIIVHLKGEIVPIVIIKLCRTKSKNCADWFYEIMPIEVSESKRMWYNIGRNRQGGPCHEKNC